MLVVVNVEVLLVVEGHINHTISVDISELDQRHFRVGVSETSLVDQRLLSLHQTVLLLAFAIQLLNVDLIVVLVVVDRADRGLRLHFLLFLKEDVWHAVAIKIDV